MSNMIFIFTPKKLKRKIIFDVLRINKKFTFYCDKLSIETKKSQIHTPPPSTQLLYSSSSGCKFEINNNNNNKLIPHSGMKTLRV